jgi:kynurenine formamidase
VGDREGRYVDLSHPIHEGMPVYPNDPNVRIRQEASIDADGYALRSIRISSHTGTHVDAPAHILRGAPGIEEIPLERFIGMAALIDCRERHPRIGLDCVQDAEALIRSSNILLLQTGWDRHWGMPAYFQGYPVLHPEAAMVLAQSSLSVVGIDAPSFDAADSEDYPIHRLLLGAGKMLIENLTGLAHLPRTGIWFSAFPLSLGQGADASPVRAVAWIENGREDFS